MKVAIDSQTTRSGDKGRGIGFHTKLLIEHLEKFKGLEVELIDTRQENLAKFDVIHYPAFDTHLSNLPSFSSKPTVVTVHDVIKLIYPKQYPLGIKGKIRLITQKKRLQRADAIITISETSKKDIVRLLDIPANKIYVTYLASQPLTQKVSADFVKQVQKKYHLPEKFILYVGGVNYNKNLVNLAKASIQANMHLVLVGKETTKIDFDKSNIENQPWVEFIKMYGDNKLIHRLGYVEDNELAAIWKLTTLYCQPSYYEGFGLPLLEAFENKVPVVASKTQALVEVGDSACVFVDPNSSKDFAQAFKDVSNNKALRSQLIKSGTKRIKDFSWDKCALETYNIYKKLHGE